MTTRIFINDNISMGQSLLLALYIFRYIIIINSELVIHKHLATNLFPSR